MGLGALLERFGCDTCAQVWARPRGGGGISDLRAKSTRDLARRATARRALSARGCVICLSCRRLRPSSAAQPTATLRLEARKTCLLTPTPKAELREDAFNHNYFGRPPRRWTSGRRPPRRPHAGHPLKRRPSAHAPTGGRMDSPCLRARGSEVDRWLLGMSTGSRSVDRPGESYTSAPRHGRLARRCSRWRTNQHRPEGAAVCRQLLPHTHGAIESRARAATTQEPPPAHSSAPGRR